MNFLEISLVFFYNDNNPQRFFQECWKQNRRGSMEQRYSVTQAAQILGVRASVLRYWEDELNLRISRNEQGHRYYTGYDITQACGNTLSNSCISATRNNFGYL